MCDHDGVINYNNTRHLVGASSPTILDCKNTSFDPFRGFEKVPTVVIERFDITPYLPSKQLKGSSQAKPRIKWKIRPTKRPLLREQKSKRPRPKPSRKPILKEPIKVPANFVDHSSKFSVHVFRDDLEKLKELFNKSPKEFEDSKVITPSMSLKCNICEKLYSSEKKLQNHQENKHMIIYKPEKEKPQKRVSFSDKVIVHELKEYHKCRKCPKIFENYRALKSHMKEQHKKRKCYICNYCTKKFVDRMFFKVHIKLHCDLCGLLFSSKTKCNDHKRNICKTLKFHKCRTCNINFFKLMDLKDHSYEHINDCFVCDICKDQCSSKCAVAHHIYFLHSKRRKTFNLSLYVTKKIVRESLFLCRFCEESSVDRDLIEKHVELLSDLTNKAMTGYKDYYFCDQCLKQFDTESDMLQHKWTHFLKTSDNSQLRPKDTQLEKKELKTFYNIKEGIPESFQPKIVLEKLKLGGQVLKGPVEFVDVNAFDINSGNIKKAIVHPKSKKTLLSKHQCENCGKYYSTSYCLNRHIETQHSDYENLRCGVCEEVFVWPSLLKSHKCIRLQIPEMPFEDARPEIHFDNLHELSIQNLANGETELNNGFDDLNIVENYDYMNSVDFEIPAPIIDLTEQENSFIPVLQNGQVNQNLNKVNALQTLGYKIVMQEVPIEF